MNPRTYPATVRRTGLQLLGDPRTVGLIVVVPALLVTLLYFVFRDQPAAPGAARPFDRIAVTMIAVLPMVVMFLVTSVTMLRERSSGTLERLMTTRLHRGDLVAGYTTTFAIAAAAQALVLCAVVLGPLGVRVTGPVWLVLLTAVADAVVGVALGLLASATARSEFQAVQLMPVVIGPQLFLCGLLVPRGQMADWLHALSAVMPMSYAVDAVEHIRTEATAGTDVAVPLVILVAFGLIAMVLAAASIRRRSR